MNLSTFQSQKETINNKYESIQASLPTDLAVEFNDKIDSIHDAFTPTSIELYNSIYDLKSEYENDQNISELVDLYLESIELDSEFVSSQYSVNY